MISHFRFPTRIVFGPGAIAQLPDLLAELHIARPLLVTDPGLDRAGLAGRVLNMIETAACFKDVHPNPTEACVEAAAGCLRAEACDGIIALGGGSVIDAAKAAGIRLNHPGPLDRYDVLAGGFAHITGAVPPLIAIPTTAGTGSEVGRSAVITLRSDNRKAILLSPRILPAIALCDPELTLGLPPHLTAATGMDALTHSIEAYLSTEFHPICDAVAIGGIRLVAGSLERAVKTGDDIRARSDMMLAASMGAIAFQKDLGAAHALAHPLSTLANVPHGLANAILLPHVMTFNKPAAAARLKHIAAALGCNTFPCTDDEGADLAVEAVRTLLSRIDLPDRLSAVGVRESLIPDLVKQAIADPNHRTNPRTCTEADLADLYRAAM